MEAEIIWGRGAGGLGTELLHSQGVSGYGVNWIRVGHEGHAEKNSVSGRKQGRPDLCAAAGARWVVVQRAKGAYRQS